MYQTTPKAYKVCVYLKYLNMKYEKMEFETSVKWEVHTLSKSIRLFFIKSIICAIQSLNSIDNGMCQDLGDKCRNGLGCLRSTMTGT